MRIGDDRVLFAGHFRQEMTFQLRIERQFHLLRIDQHQLQFRRMFLVQQRRDDRVQSDRFALSGRAGYQQVRHFGQVDDERFVLNRFAEHHRDVVVRFLELHRFDDRVHRDDLLVLVRHFDADRSLARDRRDDPDAERGETLRDIVLEVLDFRNTNAGSLYDLIQRDRRPDRRFDLVDLDPEIFERFFDPVFVFDDLFARYADFDAVVFEQFDRRALVRR